MLPNSVILEASSRQQGNLQDCQTGREEPGGGTPWKGFVNKNKEGTLALPCFMKKGTHATKLDYKNLILQALGKMRGPGEALPLLACCAMCFLSEDLVPLPGPS